MNKTQRAEDTKPKTDRLLRCPKVLELFPVSKSKWFDGVRKGIYPKPVRLSARTVAWRESEILELIDRVMNGDVP